MTEAEPNWKDRRWEPTAAPGQTSADLPLNEWVGQALGAVSSCWADLAGAGSFDSSRREWIFDGLTAHLNSVVDGVIAARARSLLVLATTRELLVELEVRAGIGRLDPEWASHGRALLRMEQIAVGLQVGLSAAVLEYRPAGS